MAAPAEVQTEQHQFSNWQTAEYALSLDRLRMVGDIALSGSLEEPEAQGPISQLRAEFDTSLSEMLKTDPDFGKELEITRFERYIVRDGHVISHDGITPVVDMLENGCNLSATLAQEDSRMQTQATRDWYDLLNAHEVDAMAAGKTSYNTRIVPSLMPKEAIARDGERFWRGMGYFPETETAFFQLYHLTEDGEVLTGALSVDMADMESMRELWAEEGVHIPEGESTDSWLQHAITGAMTTEQAKALVQRLRQKHYDTIGHEPTKPTSVEEVLAVNADVVDQSFKELQLSLSESIAEGKKTEAIQHLVHGFMQKAMQLSPEIRSGLLRAHNSQFFSDVDARLVYKLVMYATVEEIRKSLPLANRESSKPAIPRGVAVHHPETMHVHGSIPTQLFINQIVQSALVGVSERRSYGACGAEIKLGSYGEENSPEAALAKLLDPQKAFGGKTERKEDEEDMYGPLKFECTEGHTNRRPRGKLIDKCQHKGCTGSVGCA